jgi:mannose-6-phosphate isomerase
MKILSLSGKETKSELKGGFFEEEIEKNDHYEVSVYYLSAGAEIEIEKDFFRAFYVLDGSVNTEVLDLKEEVAGTKTFNSGKGWLLLPTQSQIVKAEAESKIFAIKNSAPLNDLEIIDRAKKIPFKSDTLNELSDYTVNKPWGCEYWLVDTEVFVLKGIIMNSGHECSLQIHEHKIEVNLVLSGKVRLTLGHSMQVDAAISEHYKKGGNQVDFSMSKEEVDAVKNSIKPILITPGEGWRAKPYEIHQVLSLDTYFALEVSTPEVDDILRLKDLYNRQGGRIASEHQQNK